jgi:hypothetical protein
VSDLVLRCKMNTNIVQTSSIATIMLLLLTLILPYTFRKLLLDIVLYDVKMGTTNRLKGTVHFYLERYCTKFDALATG